jgi:ketosteroid isomerase-like protein
MSVRRALPAIAVAVGLAIAATPVRVSAESPQVAGDRSAIESKLEGSLAAGYREKSLEKFLSAYAFDARVVTYVWGEIDREALVRKTREDFANLSGQTAQVKVLEARIEGSAALVTINLGVTGVLSDGKPANRQDRYYLRMRKDDGGWVIVEQSYRPDFSSSAAPHGIPR